MKLIAPFYPDKSTLARAWVEALEALPGHHHRAGSFEYRQSLLSRDGRYKPREVSGTFTFRPDSGAGFSQWQGSAVETPADILELNTLLKAVQDQQEFEDETRRAIDMSGGCSVCGALDGYSCICNDNDDYA